MKATTFFFVLLLTFGYGGLVATRASAQTDTPTNTISQPLQNGIYAVLEEATAPTSAPREGSPQVVLVYDRSKCGEAPHDEPLTYVMVDRNAFVPLIIEGTPKLQKGRDGRHVLSISLAHDQVQALEDFTRAHLGGRVATVLDGEIITLNKIRSVIVGGKVQMMRCTDDACTVVYARLTE